jgi:predicted ATPase/DNA-binding SARP family transcriptional activator
MMTVSIKRISRLERGIADHAAGARASSGERGRSGSTNTLDALWRIELLGSLRLVGGERMIDRFRTHKVGSLLAVLAYHLHRTHPREELAELLWPECYPETSRKNLRTALNSLRRQLEPPSVPSGAVLVANRASVRLNPDVCVTDVALFQTALQAAAQTDSAVERAQRLVEAAELYRGELLPGYFDDWILAERQRLLEAYVKTLDELAAHCKEAGDLHGAIQWARRVVGADPLREEAHQNLIRLLTAAGQPEAALRQYRDLERLLRQELRTAPEAALRVLARELEAQAAQTHSVNGPPPAAEMPVPAERVRWSAPVNPVRMGTPAAPSAAGTGPGRSGFLPPQFTRFFGREGEIARLEVLLGEGPGIGRLVTLTGPGGTGKTRLAQEAAARVREWFEGRIAFVPLVALTEPRLIAGQILDSLQIPRSPGVPPFEQVVAVLSSAASPGGSSHPSSPGCLTLLLLDNLEHLLPDGASVVQALLERVESLSLWVTSRQSLGLPGERELPVSPLPVPGVQAFGRSGVEKGIVHDPNARTPTPALRAPGLNALASNVSVQLFVDRAQGVRVDFQLTPANASDVARLCTGLEGIPLAIELAAARIGVLTPAQMLERLEERFELLTTRRRMADQRHQSLRVALDWSYQLLSPELQRFFTRLSVFRGGWPLEAAEAVCEEPRALEYLEQLGECSLVLAEEGLEGMRYRLLETLREFGREQLATTGEAGVIQRRHALFFLERAEAEWHHEWRETEHDNLRAALDWAVEQGEVEIGLRLGNVLWAFWGQQGYATEGRQRLSTLLALPGASAWTALRARVLVGAGYLLWIQGDFATARSLAAESVDIHRELGDNLGAAFSLRLVGMIVQLQGNYEAASSLHEECLRIHREAGDQEGIATCLTLLGSMAFERGDPATALPRCEEALGIFRRLVEAGKSPSPHYFADALDQLGIVNGALGDTEAARALCHEGLTVRQQMGDKHCTTITLYNLGQVAEAASDYAAARAHYEESLALRRELGARRGIAHCLQGLARVATAQGCYQLAVRLFAAAAALREALGSPLPLVEQVADEPRVAAIRARLGEEAFAEAWAQGAAMSLEQAMGVALEESEVPAIG